MKVLKLFTILFLLIACEKLDFEPERDTNTTGNSGITDNYRTNHHPKAPTLYNNAHVVVFSDAFHPDSAEITLLSFYDWSDVPSANSTKDPTIAQLLAQGYEESSMKDWHIPTLEEAKRLRTLYGSSQPALDSLNHLLQSIGAPEISLQSGKSNQRYLCEEARKSFSFVDCTSISPTGIKTKYHLRLLKTFRINLYQGVRHLVSVIYNNNL